MTRRLRVTKFFENTSACRLQRASRKPSPMSTALRNSLQRGDEGRGGEERRERVEKRGGEEEGKGFRV